MLPVLPPPPLIVTVPVPKAAVLPAFTMLLAPAPPAITRLPLKVLAGPESVSVPVPVLESVAFPEKLAVRSTPLPTMASVPAESTAIGTVTLREVWSVAPAVAKESVPVPRA